MNFTGVDFDMSDIDTMFARIIPQKKEDSNVFRFLRIIQNRKKLKIGGKKKNRKNR